MLTISRQTDYACRVILHLAMSPAGQRVTSQEIAKQWIIPRALVRRIIHSLAKAKLIIATRGSTGGLALARAPKEISLLDVVEVMEGPKNLNICVNDPQACPVSKTCSLSEQWKQAHEHLVAELRQATFDKMISHGIPTSSEG